jgi:hypothetical protein
MNLFIEKFSTQNEEKWDNFIMKNRFNDHSLLIKKGTNIVAVVPACEMVEKSKRIFYSHKGSTFGGIILNSVYNDIIHIDSVVSILEQYLNEQGFDKVVLKNTSEIFCNDNTSLLDYFYFKYGYRNYNELSLYIDFKKYNSIIENNFSASKRRDFKYSLNYNLQFKILKTDNEINNFYNLLLLSLRNHNTKPIHSLEELLDFKNSRFSDMVEFYGVYYKNNLIAGSMVFNFNNTVFHTQYLASNLVYSNYYPMNFLNYNLIREAYINNFRFFSFGISTEEQGKILNTSLAQFKEGFGTMGSINRTYYKELK